MIKICVHYLCLLMLFNVYNRHTIKCYKFFLKLQNLKKKPECLSTSGEFFITGSQCFFLQGWRSHFPLYAISDWLVRIASLDRLVRIRHKE